MRFFPWPVWMSWSLFFALCVYMGTLGEMLIAILLGVCLGALVCLPLAILYAGLAMLWACDHLATWLTALWQRLRAPVSVTRLAQQALPPWLVGPWHWSARLDTWVYDHLDAIKYSVIGLGCLALLLASANGGLR